MRTGQEIGFLVVREFISYMLSSYAHTECCTQIIQKQTMWHIAVIDLQAVDSVTKQLQYYFILMCI